MTIASASAMTDASVVASKPAASIVAMSSSERSSTCDRPARNPSTTRSETSSPVTESPERAAS